MEGRKPWQELLILAIILIVFVFAFINVSKLQNKFASAPTLTSNLTNLSTISEENVAITGKTDSAVTLTVNSKVISLDKDGNFSTVVGLNLGDNKINITAKNKAGKTTTIEKMIGRIAPEINTVTDNTTQPSVLSSQATGDLTVSGPAENMGVLGLSLIILSLFIYFKSINYKNSANAQL